MLVLHDRLIGWQSCKNNDLDPKSAQLLYLIDDKRLRKTRIASQEITELEGRIRCHHLAPPDCCPAARSRSSLLPHMKDPGPGRHLLATGQAHRDIAVTGLAVCDGGAAEVRDHLTWLEVRDLFGWPRLLLQEIRDKPINCFSQTSSVLRLVSPYIDTDVPCVRRYLDPGIQIVLAIALGDASAQLVGLRPVWREMIGDAANGVGEQVSTR